jgi:DNA invertase Pin-like site-specific DNA recombinase
MSAIKAKVKAVAYLRTSSATNVGPGKDSEKRQVEAIEAYAKRAGLEIVATFYDADVRGADPIDSRPQFAAMLDMLLSNGTRTIIVETASRFSRDLITQETGWAMLKEQGVALIAADSPEAFLDDTPTAVLIRQILGAVAQFEKAMLVSKLKGARGRKRVAEGKCEGRKSHAELNPELVALAKKLHRYPTNGRRRSLREVATDLAAAGHMSATGTPFTAMTIKRMVEG